MNKDQFIRQIIRDVFTVSVITLVCFVIFELIKFGFVINYFNLNLFLFWCLIIGVVYLIIDKKG
ncbi:MAG: hypothetical protein WC480_02955 [Patescibacteria group bacterium]